MFQNPSWLKEIQSAVKKCGHGVEKDYDEISPSGSLSKTQDLQIWIVRLILSPLHHAASLQSKWLIDC